MMTGTKMTLNLRLAHVTLAMTCIICILFPITSAYSLPNNRVPAVYDDLNKRDVGLEIQCASHPRNCPGGYMPGKRNHEDSQKRTIFQLGQAERARADRLRPAGEDYSISSNTIREILKRMLGDLRRTPVVYTEETKEDW